MLPFQHSGFETEWQWGMEYGCRGNQKPPWCCNNNGTRIYCVCVYVSLCVLVQPIFVKVGRVLWFKIVFGVRFHN